MRFFLFILLIASSLFLSGCESRVFGIPQSQWNTLTPAQKQQVIDGYNERRRIDAINRPATEAIYTAGGLIAQKQDIDSRKNSSNSVVPSWIHPY